MGALNFCAKSLYRQKKMFYTQVNIVYSSRQGSRRPASGV
jgi:hypothetical protein